jgi:hypothetical protein
MIWVGRPWGTAALSANPASVTQETNAIAKISPTV